MIGMWEEKRGVRRQQHVDLTTASTKPDILPGIEQATMSMTMLCSGYRGANDLGC